MLGNFALWTLLLLGQAGTRIFLGKLRASELELLSDNMRPTIMSLLFFLTIFRTQFNATFIGALVLLLCSKAAHWVVEARVNAMEQSPSDSRLVYVRLAALLVFLFLVDQAVVYSAAMRTYEQGASLLLLFGFEYCVLALTAVASFVAFLLNYISIRRQQVWHAKGTYVLYLEFVVSALKSLVYLAFFFIIFRYYGLPLHIVRSMYLTFAAFHRSLAKLLTYRRAVSGMDARYPDASPAELHQADSVCIVCRDEMEMGKKLPCGHILHVECLRSWLQQDPTCPLCRKSVIIEDLYRSDPPQYYAEYQRFVAHRAGGQAGHLHNNHNAPNQQPNGPVPDHVHNHAHAHIHQNQNQNQKQNQQQPDDIREQLAALKTQMDFIQTLLIAQMERQEAVSDDAKSNDQPSESEEDIRKKRLQFFH